MELWRHVVDLVALLTHQKPLFEALLTHQNPSYISHIDHWWPLRQWFDVLMIPHTERCPKQPPH